jgi:hypothetical protein
MMLHEAVRETRARIARVEPKEVRYGLMASYLWAARASEVVGVASATDTTTPYGPRGSDAYQDAYKPPGEPPVPVAVFRIKTAKRGGFERYIALPLEPKYEPWAKELLDYCRSKGSKLVFPYTRQTLHAYASRAFDGLTYDIALQRINGVRVEAHKHNAGVHFLRHIRASELVSSYGFKSEELAAYGGWSLKSVGVSPSMARYLQLSWHIYFAKLLIERA